MAENVFKCLLLIALKKDIVNVKTQRKDDNSNERVNGALLLISYCVPYIIDFVIRSIDVFLKIGLIDNNYNGIITSHVFNILKGIGKDHLPNKNTSDIYTALIQVICDVKMPELTW